ncbi:cyclodeaminase/cyclohydrolase family protein [Turicimonas muris]|uniref:cyclodeaminase/cyclohydrolase family protein n=1 Tax=Turicimonas muris TaxID=1796652 RepID=UPI0026767497|nr:cyclodeaminase/cyclohydrolase family protein [Turicimonas muris]
MAEISSFLSDVASSAPAPGGGSCSAIALAQAAALISKVMSLSMKDASEKQKENYAVSLKALERMRGLLIELADKDSQIFLDLIAAFRLPKNSPEEIEKRRIEIRTRYSEAAESPLNMIKAASPLRANIIFLMHNGNQNALSDTLCAAKLFEAGIQGALFNLKINIPHLSNGAVRTNLEKACLEYQSDLNRFSVEVKEFARQQNYL